jgi:Trk K+ transport system NAD-binding subunit
VKFLPAQLAYFLSLREERSNVIALLRNVAFVIAVIVLYSVLFHVIMAQFEGQQHSWLTGFYWTLTVMTTLGFGDITFESDLGRAFSVLVLLSGVILLLIVLPFTFIRLFFAPWLEAQVRLQAPREAPEAIEGHVILCAWDMITPGLVQRLRLYGIPYLVIEPDPLVAASMHRDGIAVMTGDVDSSETYRRLRIDRARMVVANREDTTNTNIVLTVREVAPRVSIVATANNEDSIDILQLSGASHVLPLKRRLGELLVHRVNVGHAQSHVIGSYRNLLVAEFMVHRTGFAGKTVRETGLREAIGINFIGVWERGRLQPARPDFRLTESCVAVVVGTREQIDELDALLVIYDANYSPALVIGGGKVGRAAAKELRRREFPVHLIERDPSMCAALAGVADRVFCGDAADRAVLEEAGVAAAPSVLLTTNDDAMNIYLSVYCRRLNPELRIVSRITHERNLEAIHRAGADFVLSYASLGIEHIFSLVRGRELVLLGEQFELFAVAVPNSLSGRTLAESSIGDRTGLNVIALQEGGEFATNPTGSHRLLGDSELVMLGSAAQLERFHEVFGG